MNQIPGLFRIILKARKEIAGRVKFTSISFEMKTVYEPINIPEFSINPAKETNNISFDRIVELHRLLKLGNVGLMKDWCHGMKGTASLLGAKDLQLQVEILNKTLDEATQPDITQQVNMIINTIRTVAVELNKLFTKGIKQHMNRP